MATGIFTYAKPVNQIEKNNNKEALLIVETKRDQMGRCKTNQVE
jgi:hypothetical protein